VAALSQRLRVLHSELTTETLELRYEQLRDEVQRVVSTLQPHERERFLQELMAEFPVWSAGGAPLPSAPSTSATVMIQAAPEITDPKVLMEKLAAACKGLPENDRARIEGGLRSKGVVKQDVAMAAGDSGGAPSEGELTALRALLGLPAEAKLDAERAATLGPIGAEFLIKGVEGVACAYWSQLCSSAAFTTKFSMAQVLKRDIEKLLAGDPKVGPKDVERNVNRLRALFGAMVLAFKNAPEQVAREHMNKFAPSEIQKAVGQGGFFGNQDARCWQMYVEMMKNVDKASMERKVRALIAQDIEGFLESSPHMRAAGVR